MYAPSAPSYLHLNDIQIDAINHDTTSQRIYVPIQTQPQFQTLNQIPNSNIHQTQIAVITGK